LINANLLDHLQVPVVDGEQRGKIGNAPPSTRRCRLLR
jgi:hypothetical protein